MGERKIRKVLGGGVSKMWIGAKGKPRFRFTFIEDDGRQWFN